MDSKTFVSRLAKLNDSDTQETVRMIKAFAAVLQERGSDLDSIAIPGFGSFVSMKRAEHIGLDQKTGKRMLIPPKIMVEFVAASKLKKSLTNE